VHVIRDDAATAVNGFGACPGMQRIDDDAYETSDGSALRRGRMVITDLDHEGSGPWMALLPAVVHIRASSSLEAAWVRETLSLLRGAHALPASVRSTVATSLGQLLFAQALEGIDQEGDVVRDAQIASVLAEVRSAPSLSWELSELAKRAGLSRSVFVERGTALLGKPVGRWIRDVRLERARDLLRTTDAAVKEVASRVGYANESAFARAFMREHGVSPARYRESASQRAS
jgi:transcriptional regulator GlxA family with amidase domain